MAVVLLYADKVVSPSIVRLPVIVPPALGKAAPAVAVVDVKIASLVAMSIPSTVPLTTTLPVTSIPVDVVSSLKEPLCPI